jgi:hypothetical protein
MAAVVGECMRRNTSFLSVFKTASPFANSSAQASPFRQLTHFASAAIAIIALIFESENQLNCRQ